MAELQKIPPGNKISSEFAARLNRLKPEQQVRVIVLLRSKDSDKSSQGRRQSGIQRRAAVEKIRGRAKFIIKDIDEILKHVGGHRLESQPSALGSILVETTAAGVNALAKSSRVKAIMEDQRVAALL
jgi:hypothetical protein